MWIIEIENARSDATLPYVDEHTSINFLSGCKTLTLSSRRSRGGTFKNYQSFIAAIWLCSKTSISL